MYFVLVVALPFIFDSSSLVLNSGLKMAKYSKQIINRFLSEEAYRSLKLGFFAIYKRPNLTSADELEDLKDAIVKGNLCYYNLILGRSVLK